MKAPRSASVAATNATSKRRGRKGTPRQADPALRVKVEEAAIDRVIAHYGAKHYSSVEKDNKGWDLEVARGNATLLVEVKGCSGKSALIELTPNEYSAMQRQANRDACRLAIVTRALEKRHARISIIAFNGSDETWRDQDGRRATLAELTWARVAL